MIVVDPRIHTRVMNLEDGRLVYLTQDDWGDAEREAQHVRSPVLNAVDLAVYEQECAERESSRQYQIVRLAVSGRFTEILDQLKVWGVQPTFYEQE